MVWQAILTFNRFNLLVYIFMLLFFYIIVSNPLSTSMCDIACATQHWQHQKKKKKHFINPTCLIKDYKFA